MGNKIFILGVGHNTPVCIDLAQSCGYEVAGLYHYNDSRTGEIDHGFPILGSFNDLFSADNLEGKNFVLSQGDSEIREELFLEIKRKNGFIPSLIHPSAEVSQFAKIGEACLVEAFCLIHPDVVIGNNTVISYRSSVSHSSAIGKNCFIAPGALVGAYTEVKDYVFIGLHATTISGKVPSIGEYSIIGAGAIVIKSVDSHSVMAGCPAVKIGVSNKKNVL